MRLALYRHAQALEQVQKGIVEAKFPWTAVRTVVIVPYSDRDPRQCRSKQLEVFCSRMPSVLDAALGPGLWAILVAEQSADAHKFSRGRLFNAASRIAQKWFPSATSWVLHDVDLLPDTARAAAFADVPLHVLRALNTDSVWYSSMEKYIGGICAVHPKAFAMCGGFHNAFEGWGGEDDCFRNALDRKSVV